MRLGEYISNGAAIANGRVGGFKRDVEVGPTPPPVANGQYMLVAKPIADIKAIIDRERAVAKKTAGRTRYRHSLMYAIRELKIEGGDPSAYRTGWNAAVEAALDTIRKVE